MDRPVMYLLPRFLFVAGLLVCLLPFAASGETFSDPTRPVPLRGQSEPAAGEGAATQVGASLVVTAKEGVMALMDGRIVRVGSRMDDGVVVRITPDAVFLRSSKGQERRVPLYPDVRLTPAAKPAVNAERSVKK